jgi:uncharacterized protein (UPF0303 family)
VFILEDYTGLLEQLLQQERDLQFTEFTNNTAVQIGTAILEYVRIQNKSVVVDIQRNGQPIFHGKMDGTTINNDQWIKRKNNVTNHFGHSSYYMHVLLKSRNKTIQEEAYLDPIDYAAEGGAFPIFIKNVGPIGTITVSGLPGEEDHGTIVSVLTEFIK